MLRTYGLKVHYGTAADGVVDWVGDRLLYGHISFSMPDLRAMIHGLVHASWLRFKRRLLLLHVDDEGRPNSADTTTRLPLVKID
ncbi:hypothetical protein NA57DRAFT_49383 [Rhizodiscina lignyota]|uniref:Uncharacterized protein n=1 Tax=Rhizodiscina lignyota TaxID=1504668 RepID=A0A9P4M361_9PEZI|nr:hypothetical protein NA57DRAFT_49383 [Rhizodiscina lignyota]